MLDLTGLQRDCIVGIDSHESLGGLAVKDVLNEYNGGEINHERLYPDLDELVSAGYVEKGQIDDRTNACSVTEEGRELIEERLEGRISTSICEPYNWQYASVV